MKEKLLLAAAALLGFATACNNEEDQPKVVSMYGVPYNNYKIKGKVTDKAGRPIKGIEVREQRLPADTGGDDRSRRNL